MPTARHNAALHTIVAALCALALAGCGGGDSEPQSDSAKVTTTIESYLAAQVSGDGTAACALLSPAGQRQLIGLVAKASQGLVTQPTCEDAVSLVRTAATPAQLAAVGHAEVSNVVVSGDRATADVGAGAALPSGSVTLVRDGSDWLISGVPALTG
jgi:hypothetical protein